MDIGSLIESHGYAVLAIGSLLEGETVLLLAGFAAHRGYLDIRVVVAVAAAAGFVGDQALFWLGRRHRAALLARFPLVAAQAGRVGRQIERYPLGFIVGVRFAYGLRIAGPVLIGAHTVPASRFVLFNALGAVLWAVSVAALGYFFGHAAERVLGRIQHVEGWLALALATLGLLVWAWRRSRRRG